MKKLFTFNAEQMGRELQQAHRPSPSPAPFPARLRTEANSKSFRSKRLKRYEQIAEAAQPARLAADRPHQQLEQRLKTYISANLQELSLIASPATMVMARRPDPRLRARPQRSKTELQTDDPSQFTFYPKQNREPVEVQTDSRNRLRKRSISMKQSPVVDFSDRKLPNVFKVKSGNQLGKAGRKVSQVVGRRGEGQRARLGSPGGKSLSLNEEEDSNGKK